MSRQFAVTPQIPNIGEPIAYMGGDPVFLTDVWRQYFEQDNLAVTFGGADLVKQANDGVEAINTDYYTRAQSDAIFATISTTYTQSQVNSLLSGKANTSHTHSADAVTSGTFADARIPSLAISKTTGLQAALDSKVDEGDFGSPVADMSLIDTHYIDLTLPNGDVFRLHGELNP